jgi:hypothetical protein
VLQQVPEGEAGILYSAVPAKLTAPIKYPQVVLAVKGMASALHVTQRSDQPEFVPPFSFENRK